MTEGSLDPGYWVAGRGCFLKLVPPVQIRSLGLVIIDAHFTPEFLAFTGRAVELSTALLAPRVISINGNRKSPSS